MGTLTAWKFDTSDGAQQLESLLVGLQQQQLITVQDAAIVTWPVGAKKPKTRQLHNLAGIGALDGAFWGMFFGLLFFVPFLGLAVGAATGALTGALSDVGIDNRFIEQVKQQVTPGTSALFVLSDGAVPDRVLEEIERSGLQPTLLSSNLPAEQEQKLRESFATQ